MSLLRRFLRPSVRPLALVVLFQLAATIASLYLPSLNAELIDRGVSLGDTGFILRTGGVMLLATGVQILCSLAATFFAARVAMRFGRDLRAAIFRKVGSFSAREVSRFGAPSLITRTTNDVQQVQTVVLMSSTMLVLAPIMCVGGIVMALHDDLSLSRLLLVSVPLLVGSIVLIVSRTVPKYRAMQPQLDAVNRILREQINGARVIRAFVRDRAEAARFDGANVELTDTALAIGKLQALMFPMVMLIFNASTVAVLYFGAERIGTGSLEVGALTAFIAYLMQILVAVMLGTFMSVMIPRAAACAERICEVLATEPSLHAPDALAPAPAARGLVELRGVDYRYPGAERPVLRNVSFVAAPGTVTAIIGGTGSGKTTLLDLVARMIDPTLGSVLVDGLDVRQFELETLWSRIGVVPQRPYLFSGTVASNLRYGDPDASDEALWEALEAAQGRDFVEAMPEKLDAPIGQGGKNVSGGQRQRLSIARTLLRRPAIYLLDDVFSALDTATEARLRAALKVRARDATVILVAQRVASIVEADQILVLDGGTIVGRGRHHELLQTCPAYAEIVASQRDLAVAA